MLRWLGAFTLLSAAVHAGAVHAAPTERTFQVATTRDLAELCATESSHPLATAAGNFCVGFVVGAYAVMKEIEDAAGSRRQFCLPEPPPSRPQAIAAFVQWAQRNPSQLDLPPADGFFRFLQQRFPCGGKP